MAAAGPIPDTPPRDAATAGERLALGLLMARKALPLALRRRLGPPPPRRVWACWDRGEAAAPPVARRCLDAWRARNPGWALVVLDRAGADPLPAAHPGRRAVAAWRRAFDLALAMGADRRLHFPRRYAFEHALARDPAAARARAESPRRDVRPAHRLLRLPEAPGGGSAAGVARIDPAVLAGSPVHKPNWRPPLDVPALGRRLAAAAGEGA